jgi:hypothetical protein
MRMKPQIPVTLVALGLSSESMMSKAIMKVHPEKLSGVRYLSIHGEVPQTRETISSMSSRRASGGGDDDEAVIASGATSTVSAAAAAIASEYTSAANAFTSSSSSSSSTSSSSTSSSSSSSTSFGEIEEEQTARTAADVTAAYGGGEDEYAFSTPRARELQAMTCMAVDGANEECIFSPSGWEGPMGPWFADPTTIASWIGKCL